VQEIISIIHDVNQSGVTILLVEQNAKMALEIANRAYVLGDRFHRHVRRRA
jgi:branched-chain amino acid transport system ATP-binding protein